MARLFIFILSLIGLLPRFMLKGISKLIYFFVRLFGYRRKIINENLDIAFPEKTKEEKRQIRIQFYRYFADYFVEFMMLLRLDKEKVVGRDVFLENAELLNKARNAGKPIFVLAGHVFNWEWVGMLGKYIPQKYVYAAYKPLKNKEMNDEIEKLRFRMDGEGVASKDIINHVRTNPELNESMYYMIVDQSPKVSEMKKFVNFFGVPTPVFGGYELLIRRTKGAVGFVYPEKVDLGKYVYHLTEIKPDGEKFEGDEVVNKFYRELETHIKRNPANWLWSHRRWKNLDPAISLPDTASD